MYKSVYKFIIVIFSLLVSNTVLSSEPFSHQLWQELLAKNVRIINNGQSNQVDYAGFSKDRDLLKNYLSQLSKVSKKEFISWNKDKRLAFLINSYNAWTIEYILTKWPNIKSIKELGGFISSPWKKEFIPLLDEVISLDRLENDFIRKGNYQEPRIHFALNCASKGCPSLRAEAYQEGKLKEQLEQQTQLFLSDGSRNYLQDDTLIISPIFKWYRKDFEINNQSLIDFLNHYSRALKLSDVQKKSLSKIKIKFDDYDWSLNGLPK